MIPMQVIVTREGWPAAPKRAIRNAMKKTLRNSALQWHGQMLPAHFETSAVSKYGYAKRKKQYQIKKAREKGHQRPLEWSGDLKREATSSVEVRGNSKRVKAHFRARAANFTARKRNVGATGYPDIRGELSAITSDEIGRLAASGSRSATRELNRYRARRRKTIR